LIVELASDGRATLSAAEHGAAAGGTALQSEVSPHPAHAPAAGVVGQFLIVELASDG